VQEQPKKAVETPKKPENPFVMPTFTYQDALAEMEKSSPAFMEKKRALSKDELPFDVEPKPMATHTAPTMPAEQKPKQTGYVESTYSMPMDPPENAQRPPKAKPKKMTELQRQFPDLYVETTVLQFNDGSVAQTAQKAQPDVEADIFAENKKYLAELDEKAKQNRIDVSSCTYAGKLFNTYLLYERNQEVYIIDQHAAHERLIFNRLREQMQSRNVARQPMLMPYVLELNAFESAFIRENIERIRDMGFDIDEFGDNTYKVDAVPVDLIDMDLGVFFNDILGDINGYRAIKLDEILKDKLATAACKAAVKGGMDLTRGEIDALFELMDGDMGLKCPHGRPVVVKMTKTELEKMFKRIV
jgi:DNA mismatch repair protein MutL